MYHQGQTGTKNEILSYLNCLIINVDSLPSIQRDKLLLDESKEDAQFRRDLTAVMRKSTVRFTASMENIGRSMTQLGNSLCLSIEMLSRVMYNNSNISSSSMMPPNQNLMYRNIPRQQQPV